MWTSMQMTQNLFRVTHLLTVQKLAGMHCTQQTTAQLTTERRGGGAKIWEDTWIITKTCKIVK